MSVVNVIGLGYIGLPTALMLASSNVDVVGTDLNRELVNTLNASEVTFEEQGLKELFHDALLKGVKFTTEYVQTSKYIVAVPTPYNKVNKRIDTGYLVKAITEILKVCDDEAIVIIESTVSPGTINKHIRPLISTEAHSIGKKINLVHAPERIIPGNTLQELRKNSRTIGADSPEVGKMVKTIYSSFCEGEIVITDIRTAEMTKVVENTYRDINIAFANELTKICREDNMDIYEIIKIANMHPRVNILHPGPGVGGHCISVDPWFLVGDYPDLTNLILTARKVNDSMPGHVLKRIRDIMSVYNIKDISKVGLYGLTYKEDVDDVRESPTLQLLEKLDEHLSFGIKVYDPYVKSNVVDNQFFNFRTFIDSIEILVIMVAHRHLKENIELVKNKIVLDTKNIQEIKDGYKL